MSTTWDPIMDTLDDKHCRVFKGVFWIEWSGAQTLNQLPWSFSTSKPIPRNLPPTWWWNNVSLANTTQDGV